MAKLIELITTIEENLNIRINGNYLEDLQIKYIRFITNEEKDLDASSEVLYLADYEKNPLKNLGGNILYTNCNEPIPNAIYTEEKDIIAIYNLIEKQLERFAGEEEKKKNLFVLLHQKDGIQPLLVEAHQTLNLPITVINSGYTIIATEHDEEKPKSNEAFVEEKFLGKEYINRMRNEGIQEKLVNYLYPFEVYLPGLEVYSIFCSIRIKNAVVAYLYIECGDRRLKKADYEYINVLSQAISIQLQKDYSYQNPKAIQYNSFFNNLLANEIKTPDDLPFLAMGATFKKYKYYFFICWSFRESDTNSISLNFQQYEIKKMLGNAISNIRNKYFVSLVSTDNFEEYLTNHNYVLDAFLTMNNMLASISFKFDDLSQARIYYDQAKYQLEYYLFNHAMPQVLYYKDFYLTHLVDIADNKPQIMATVNDKIKNMQSYDQENHTNYIDTLIEYIKNNRNAPETAKALFIHKSTLFYRFSKMNELFNIDLTDYNECFSYEYSLRILKLI